MDELLERELKKAKEMREKLIKKGYHIPISWEDVKRAMIFNHNELKKYKDGKLI